LKRNSKNIIGETWKRQCISKYTSLNEIIEETKESQNYDFCLEYEDYSLYDLHYDYVCIPNCIRLQSEESGKLVTNATTNNETCVDTNQETVEFMDENPGGVNGNDFVLDHVTLTDHTPNVELARFLSRPVNISTTTFQTTDIVGNFGSFNPWSLYFNTPKIRNKLANFAYLRCNLNLKFVVNASPFLYGAYLYNYLPLPVFTPDLVTTDSANNQIMEYSQRPHMWMYPQNSEGGTIKLPFFYPQNWLRTSILSDFTNMGTMFVTCVVPLASANGATSSVQTQIFAWATEVELAAPTASIILQSQDEYVETTGVVSYPASAIASMMGMLKKAPIIGNFARASEIGFGSIAKIAAIFGYTNVPVIKATDPYRPNAFPQFASPEISYPTEKLTIDPKNELSIDPTTVGLPVNDELEVSYLVQRESYLTTFNWSTTNAANDILFTSLVTPKLYNIVNVPNWQVHQTPLSMVSALFSYWRGDIIFRFKFICTQFHKGRVRITFDPAGNGPGNILIDADTYQCTFTKVVDIAKDTDVEIRVPYMQALPWLQCHVSDTTYSPTMIAYTLSPTPVFARSDIFDNGYITVRPVTPLTAPITTSIVKVLVSVRGAENLEFAAPREVPQNLSPFTLQSTFEYEDPDAKIMNNIITAPAPGRFLTNFGEAIPSLRSLLRRTNLSLIESIPTDTTSVLGLYILKWSRYPLYYGYQLSNGIHSAKGILFPLLNFKMNYVHTGPYHWLAPAFIGQKGSFHWHLNVDNPNAFSSIKTYRNPVTSVVGRFPVNRAKISYSSDAQFYTENTVSGAAGQSLTNQFTQSGLSISIPNYTNYRFQSTNPNNPNAMQAGSADGSDKEFVTTEIAFSGLVNSGTTNLRMWKYYSVGTDFNLYFFINTPTLVNYASSPIPN
jgi:hypothetical protein